MKKLLKIPAVILFGSAFYTWFAYDEYISLSETLLPWLNFQGVFKHSLLPWLNFQGVFKQVFNTFIVCIQGGLGAFLWELSGDKKESGNDDE